MITSVNVIFQALATQMKYTSIAQHTLYIHQDS